MHNEDYEREYFFDIDRHLCENYNQMSIPTRRAICTKVLRTLDDDLVAELVDQIIAEYALEKLGFLKPETAE